MTQEHAFFIYKDKGMSRRLRGKIAVELVFVADRESVWTQREMDDFYAVYKTAVTDLSRQAAAIGVTLTFTTTVGRFLYAGQLRSGSEVQAVEQQVHPRYLRKQGFSTNSAYVAARKQSVHADEVAVIFVLERHFRAFAMPGQDAEYCCLTQDNDTHAVAHELLHLFGAIDLYYPYHIYGLTMTHFPGSVMCSYEGQEVDPLTRYLVGWTDCLPPEAKAFIDLVDDYTPQRYQKACTLEVYRDREAELLQYVTPFGSMAEVQAAAKRSDPWAEFLMGLCYLQGIGVSQNLAWAEAYFTLSGRTGMTVSAMLHAQLLVLRGVETQRDRENLQLLLNYNSGNHMKLNSLRAACVLTGYGFDANADWASREAIRCYQEEEAFAPYAKRSLELLRIAEKLCSRLPKLLQVVAKMRQDYEEMLANGDPDLQFLIARILEAGIYAQQDLAGAFTLYQQAARGGNWRAAQETARCCRRGIGTEKNTARAAKWDVWAEKCKNAHPLDAFCKLV